MPVPSTTEPGETPSLVRDEHEYHVIGLDHRTTPLDVRSRFALLPDTRERFLSRVRQLPRVLECLYLTTCNRAELLVVTSQDTTPAEAPADRGGTSSNLLADVCSLFAETVKVPEAELSEFLRSFSGRTAVSHFFRIAAGLESMVVGEPQILGQVKRCYNEAREAGIIQRDLNALFCRAFRVGKLVRSRTYLSRYSVSFGCAIKDLTLSQFPGHADLKVAILGAGEMAVLVARHLCGLPRATVELVSRDPEKGISAAKQVGARWRSWTEVGSAVCAADVVVGAFHGAAGVTVPDLGSDVFQLAGPAGHDGSVRVFFDLGVPPNFPNLQEGERCRVYRLDDLRALCERNAGLRAFEAKRAEIIIEEEVAKFEAWRKRRSLDALVAGALRHLKDACEPEVRRSSARLVRSGTAGEISREAVERELLLLRDAVIKKILHLPLSQLEGVDGSAVDEAFRRFFSRPKP